MKQNIIRAKQYPHMFSTCIRPYFDTVQTVYAFHLHYDVIIFSNTVQYCIGQVYEIQTAVTDTGVTLNIKKSLYFITKLKIRSHFKTRSSEIEKTKVIHFVKPNERQNRDINIFLRSVNFNCHFIEDLTGRPHPLKST